MKLNRHHGILVALVLVNIVIIGFTDDVDSTNTNNSVLFVEDFEGQFDSRVSIITSQNLRNPSAVDTQIVFGNSKALRFGISDCIANCYNNGSAYKQPYFGMRRITFPSPVYTSAIRLEWGELGANWRSGGLVHLDEVPFV
ncbi:MAG: hypothetical protein CL946_00990 [Ectothiorhodospiraceae bacterium]|nr:hypothetical protein [Ectothiorhodospiraceae bacterium]